ncbi:MAG: hypothetical protein DMC60_13250 [Verrucomicrobia bacterium]|nr:MAG: hypothetical protein DMC60_13250 [Verrucomicrobiota bacterium]
MLNNSLSRSGEQVTIARSVAALLLVPAAVILSLYPLNWILGTVGFYTASIKSRRCGPLCAKSCRSRNVRVVCAPCKGGAFQWVQIPSGNRSNRKQSEQSWR